MHLSHAEKPSVALLMRIVLLLLLTEESPLRGMTDAGKPLAALLTRVMMLEREGSRPEVTDPGRQYAAEELAPLVVVCQVKVRALVLAVRCRPPRRCLEVFPLVNSR